MSLITFYKIVNKIENYRQTPTYVLDLILIRVTWEQIWRYHNSPALKKSRLWNLYPGHVANDLAHVQSNPLSNIVSHTF